jgi:hypothetical protein
MEVIVAGKARILARTRSWQTITLYTASAIAPTIIDAAWTAP